MTSTAGTSAMSRTWASSYPSGSSGVLSAWPRSSHQTRAGPAPARCGSRSPGRDRSGQVRPKLRAESGVHLGPVPDRSFADRRVLDRADVAGDRHEEALARSIVEDLAVQRARLTK